MKNTKPQHPLPMLLRRVLRKTLRDSVYRRYVGRHEDGSLALWKRFAEKIPTGTTILDVGAFHGEYSLAAKEVNDNATVVAFEPNPSSCFVLRQSCESKGVDISPLAVSEANGVVQFLCASEESRIIAHVQVAAEVPAGSVSVTAVSLDSWTSENGVRPSLMKIDVEGAEGGILRGGQRILRECQPVILCEVLSDAAASEVMSALPKSYKFWYVDENSGVAKLEPHITRHCWRNKNWLLLPEHVTPPLARPFAHEQPGPH